MQRSHFVTTLFLAVSALVAAGAPGSDTAQLSMIRKSKEER